MDKEFSLKAIVVGLVLAMVLAIVNIYLGLKTGLTILAVYPAAVAAIVVFRFFKESTLLEENLSRSVGSIGTSVAVGALVLLPTFLMSGTWSADFFSTFKGYLRSTLLLLVGGVAGILFAAVLRRVIVKDSQLPFPESAVVGEVHKTLREGAGAGKYLFYALGMGGLIEFFTRLAILKRSWTYFISFIERSVPGTGMGNYGLSYSGINIGGGFFLKAPSLSPALLGIGYIVGPRLAASIIAGGLLAWGVLVPLLLMITAPQYSPFIGAGLTGSGGESVLSWDFIADRMIFVNLVRPIALGAILTSAAFTLFTRRHSLISLCKPSGAEAVKVTSGEAGAGQTDKDIDVKIVLVGTMIISVTAFFIYWWVMGFGSRQIGSAVVLAVVVMIAGFFFAAMSGYLIGLIGSSAHPVSGLTTSTLAVSATLTTVLGATGTEGINLVLAAAGVIIVASMVAGQLLQDLRVGHLLGATPWKIQLGDLLGVIVSAVVMWFPLFFFYMADFKRMATQGYKGGFGYQELSASQSSLVDQLTKGVVGSHIAWPLIFFGALMVVGLILVRVKNPLLVCVGMYLNFEIVAAVFVGSLIRWAVDRVMNKRELSKKGKAAVETRGLLLASGLIAGEALMGLVFAVLAFFAVNVPRLWEGSPYLISVAVMGGLGYLLVRIPLDSTGDS